jgi:3-deoxy-7-phosphoheptulonate synthase
MAAKSAIFSTTGNEDSHIILRGGKKPNYDANSVDQTAKALKAAGLVVRLMIDFSHANSSKQYEKQLDVCRDVAGQIALGEDRIMGVMVESHLLPGRQNVVAGKPLNYGQSITDACVGWDHSVEILTQLAEAVTRRRALPAARAAS